MLFRSKSNLEAKAEVSAEIIDEALDNRGQGLERVEDEEETNNEQPAEETAAPAPEVEAETESQSADVNKLKFETEE